MEETTLGDFDDVGGIAEAESIGNGAIVRSCFDSSRRALRTGSPAAKDGTVFDGGCVRIVVISLAACFK